MGITGIHHITLICESLERSTAFYRNLLGMRMVKQTVSEDELEGWRGYLTGQGVPCTEVMDRTFFKSVYLRDPDGHIVELATVLPGITPDE